MRAPFQVIVFPYRRADETLEVLIGKRSDNSAWQAISGGGEDEESPLETAKRELFEETSLEGNDWLQLDSMCMLPKIIYADHKYWSSDLLVIPEYSFMVQANGAEECSNEHTELVWLEVSEADKLLKHESNKIALWELSQRVGL